jgi:nitroreductase
LTERAPQLGLSSDQLLTTTRAVRHRLDLDRPVERPVVEECLRVAFQAPTGANAQNWGWIVVDDQATRNQMADLYRLGHERHRHAFHDLGIQSVSESQIRFARPNPLLDLIDRVPILLVPAFRSLYGARLSTYEQATHWGSILPAVWSFMLALRARGLGTCWTTINLLCEKEMADLLGIPDDYVQAGMFPVAYTIGTDFNPADRAYSEQRIFWNRWDGQ